MTALIKERKRYIKLPHPYGEDHGKGANFTEKSPRGFLYPLGFFMIKILKVFDELEE